MYNQCKNEPSHYSFDMKPLNLYFTILVYLNLNTLQRLNSHIRLLYLEGVNSPFEITRNSLRSSLCNDIKNILSQAGNMKVSL